LAVDTLGLPIVINVSSANVHDGKEGIELLWQLEKASYRVQLIRASNWSFTTEKARTKLKNRYNEINTQN
jgi:hypothetical protein